MRNLETKMKYVTKTWKPSPIKRYVGVSEDSH